MKIYIEQVIKKNNRIEIKYKQEGLEGYIDTDIIPYWEYDCNIEDVPDSIAVIPFISNILPLVFVLDVELYVTELDKAFNDCIDDYRSGYQKMIPMLNFGGKIIVDKTINNIYENKKNCLLYSGGIDATNSLAVHDQDIDDCITIWGSDIKSDNQEGWTKMSASIEDTVKKYKKNWIVIRSNFREYIREDTLGNKVRITGDSWWHGFQHGIAILGHVAPLVYLNGYEKIFIASSFTEEYRTICASDPLTDNCFKIGSSYAVHDGFEFDRCQKVKNIFNSIEEKKFTLNLHVCWESSSGKNCGHCEKCIRSYLNCRAVNCDPRKIGIAPSVTMKEIRNKYTHNILFSDNDINRITVIIRNAQKTYGNNPPLDLKWLVNFDPNTVNDSIYWKFKKLYRKFRYGK